MVYGDIAEPFPMAPIIYAVGKGDVDVAIVWGPSTGYIAARATPVPRATPVADRDTSVPMVFHVAMGLRKDDAALAGEIDRFIAARGDEIEAILDAFHVPRVAPAPVQTTIGVEP
jgi:mxaJ protein